MSTERPLRSARARALLLPPLTTTEQPVPAAPATIGEERPSSDTGKGSIRQAVTSLCLAAALVVACGGGGTGPNGGGGGGGGGGGSGPTITDWSPQLPFLGETMTITGTGFSATPAQNQVELANCGLGCDKNSFPITVTAATATQLTVSLPWNFPLGTRPQRGRLRVIVNGDSVLASDTTYFAFQPEVLGFTNYDFPGAPNYAIRAGDSIKLDVYGLPPGAGPASLGLSVDGDGVSVDSVFTPGSVPGLNFGLENQASLYLRLPTKVYPAGYAPISPIDDTAYVQVTFTARGRSSTRVLRAWRYPRYQIPSGIGGTFSVGQSHTFVVNGTNMPGPFSVIFSPLGGGAATVQAGSVCASLCNSFQVGLPALAPGNYTASLRFDAFVGNPTAFFGGVTIQ